VHYDNYACLSLTAHLWVYWFFNTTKQAGKVQETERLKTLDKIRELVFSKSTRLLVGKSKVDDEVLDNLEVVLAAEAGLPEKSDLLS